MSTPSAERIDLSEIPKKGRRLEFGAALSSLPRLMEMASATEGFVKARLQVMPRNLISFDVLGGGASRRLGGYWQVSGTLSAELWLRCERCCESFRWQVNAPVMVGVILEEGHADALPEDLEPHLLEADRSGRWLLSVEGLLEEEVILAMPAVPAHENVADCGEWVEAVVAADSAEQGAENTQDAASLRPNPFAVLAGLKTDSGG